MKNYLFPFVAALAASMAFAVPQLKTQSETAADGEVRIKPLAAAHGIPAPTLERFERTGRISLESFCRLVILFDFFDEMTSILDHTKYSTSQELEAINKNHNRKKGR